MRYRRANPFAVGRRRSGASIIEALVVIIVSSMMLSVGVALIHVLLRTERGVAKAVWYARGVSRAAEMWRNDVHAAQTAALVDPEHASDGRLELSLPEQKQVSYSVAGHALLRMVTQNGELRHRDKFYFRRGSSITLQIEEQPPLLRLVIYRPAASDRVGGADSATGERAVRSSRIEALLGRDHRYALAEGESTTSEETDDQ